MKSIGHIEVVYMPKLDSSLFPDPLEGYCLRVYLEDDQHRRLCYLFEVPTAWGLAYS